MPQNTLLDLLQRSPSLPPLSEEDQALMDAMAEREQAALRSRRTEEKPGISDAAWRAVYGTADVVEPVIGSLADLVTGATVGADPYARTQPIWEQRPSMRELGEIVSTAVMPLASPLRKAAYRALMLKKLQAQISKLEPGAARQMFERLMKTHPRVMAAFEHSGGVIRRDPSPPGSSSLEEIAENRTVGRLGRFRQGPSPKDLVPGLRDTRRYPTIGITPESFVKPLDQYPPIDLGATAAHETTHWAQALGGRSIKKADLMAGEIDKLIRTYEGLDRSVSGYRDTNAHRQLLEKIRKLRGERSALIRRVERAAARAGGRQSRQMRVEQSGFPYRIIDD
jgi:hypothetical protein